jgi:hypothetical protein
LLAPLQFTGGKGSQGFDQGAVWRPHLAAGLTHFVEGVVERVIAVEGIEHHWMACGHGWVENLPSSGFKAPAEWIAQRMAPCNHRR